MTRDQARAEAKRLAAEGLTQPAIAAKLAESGYVSTRTGAPLTNAGISYLTNSKKKRRKAPPPPSAEGAKARRNHVALSATPRQSHRS